MDTLRRAVLVSFLAVGTLALAACGVRGPSPTAYPPRAPSPTNTAAVLETPVEEPATTPEPTGTPVPLSPTAVQPGPSPTMPTSEPAQIELSVYFTDSNRYAVGTPPFEVAVTRRVPPGASLPEPVLTQFFEGPTEHERSPGLELVNSGFTGFSDLRIENGIAHVYLTGPCASRGAVYTIAQPLLANLLQFDEIQFVKIYDSDGETGQPTGPTNSIPFCLEP